VEETADAGVLLCWWAITVDFTHLLLVLLQVGSKEQPV
jgi:hypothetical protein